MRTLLARLTAVLCICTVLAGCSLGAKQNADVEVPGESDSVSGTAVTTIRLGVYKNDVNNPLLDSLISAFQSKHSQYRVELVQEAPTQEGRRLMQDRLLKGEIDVIPTQGMTGLLRNNLLPLDPYIQKSGLDLRPYGPALESMRIGGKLYDLPWRITPMVFLYHRDLVESAGLSLPEGSWTWDELRAAAAQLRSGEAGSEVWGLNGEPEEHLVWTWIRQKAGPSVLGVEPLHVREALQFFSTLTETDRSLAPAHERQWLEGYVATDPKGHFASGRAAISFENLPLPFELRDHYPFEVALAPFPVHPGTKPVSPIYAFSMGIAANSAVPDAAWAFIQFASAAEGATVVAKAGALPMYNTPEVKDAWLSSGQLSLKGSDVLFETEWYYPQVDDSGRAIELNLAVNNAINRVLSGKQDWETAMAEYQERVTR